MALGAVPVYAQTGDALANSDESSASVGEIVVTARKRGESLTDVPLAISAFTEEQLSQAGVRTIEELSTKTPGFFFSDQAGQSPGRYNSALRFRGMASNIEVASQQLGTAFLDGVYISAGVSSLGMDNIERVEVVKGPQSAQFGRSTFSGAVNFITRTPSFTQRTTVNASIETYDRRELIVSNEGALIGDKIAYRISGRYYHTDGQYRSTDGGRLGEEMTRTVQGVLYGDFGPLTVKAKAFYSQDRDGAPAGFFLGGANSRRGAGPNLHNCYTARPEVLAGGFSNFFCGALPKVDANTFADINTTLPPGLAAVFQQTSARDGLSGILHQRAVPLAIDEVGLKRNSLRLSLSADYTFESGLLADHTLTSVTGYNKMDANWIRDFDQTGATNFFSSDPQAHSDFSQEIRFASPGNRRVRYLVGASYFKVRYLQDTNGGLNIYNWDGTAAPYNGITTPINFINALSREEGRTLGVFGSLGIDILDNLTLDLEGRYQKDTVSSQNLEAPSGTGFFTQDFKSFLPRATLSFKPAQRMTMWITYSEGNLPGFFNTQLVGKSAAELAQVESIVGSAGVFNTEEKVRNYEAGIKGELFDRHVSFSLNGYFMQWLNQKTRRSVPLLLDSGQTTILTLQTNSGSSDLWGVEFETSANISDNLSAGATFNWARSKYKQFFCGFAPFYAVPNKDCSGNRNPRFPEFSGSADVTWNAPLNDRWDYFIRLDGRYFGKAFTDETNYAWTSPYFITNLRAGISRDGWRLTAYVNNLFNNDDYIAAARFSDYSTNALLGFASQQGVAVTPARKRSVGLQAVVEF
ncbi:TonB-dependent receptor [Polymorphobacter sp.]|uniref:TonB-dependent receptor n=1 Tax=Polymorphobacter sp. TaxID=1909290 RepID=UPI003F70C624